jgi:hypothetical protein
VLSQDVRVNSYSDVDASIIFSHVDIGRHCRIRRAIIDRDVHMPEGTVIGYDPIEDKRRYFVTPSGLTIVTRDTHRCLKTPSIRSSSSGTRDWPPGRGQSRISASIAAQADPNPSSA